MSSGSTAKSKLMRQLKKAGLTVTITRGGHYKVTREGYDGAVYMSHTPRSSDHRDDMRLLKKVLGWEP